MPITSGHGNPDWLWDETLLALDILYKHGKPIDRHHQDVVELSQTLRDAALHPIEARRGNFRNPDGVALKLQNLQSALDPSRGLSSSKTDRAIVERFPPERASELHTAASAVRSSLKSGTPEPTAIEDDEMFAEGWTVTKRHRHRDARLRARLLQRLKDHELACVVCDFTPPHLPRNLRESFFEAHHVVPLATAETQRNTRVSDMALLCAGCHRFLHKLIIHEKSWLGIEDARARLIRSTLD